MMTLKSKMIISYSILSLLIVSSLSVLLNISIDKLFEQYAMNRKENQIQGIISQVNQQYLAENGIYNVNGLEVIANAALQNGFMVHIRTANKEIDWDIRQHKAQECQVLLQHAETNMHSLYPKFQGGYAEKTYDLKFKEEFVGYLTIGFYGPYSLGDSELILIKSLNRSLITISIIFLFVAIGYGFVSAKRITNPITSIIRTSMSIAEGNFRYYAKESSYSQETADLVTSFNKMVRTLAIKEQQKKQITADIAHELRTPLCNLQGHMEAMIDNILYPTTERLQGCHAEILRLTRIVEQLQELNLLESKNSFLNRKYFDFAQLSESLSTDFEVNLRKKGIQLFTQAPSPAPVFGDMHRIKQCMLNLISNAINYSADDGKITIVYEKTKQGVLLRVCDNGSGISTEDLPHVFERFYRTDKSRSQSSGGMGIGLSITKAIIEAHEGEITVESRIDVGSTFIVSLPDEV